MSRWPPYALIVTGGILCLSPLVGLVLSVAGMTSAFRTLASSGSGTPEDLAAGIGHSMAAVLGSLVAGPVGLLLLVIGVVWLVRSRKQGVSPATGPS